MSRSEDGRVCGARPTSGAHYQGEDEDQRGKSPRRSAEDNRSPEVAPLTSVAIQIGLDGGT
ncbi:MAG TPA: hypothetical protein VID75_03040 [Acidimicrobiales bacterium]